MDKNLRWKVLLIVLVVAGFVWASLPLGEIDVRTYLEENAVNQDAQFQDLVKSLDVKYAAGRKKVPLSAVQILQDKAREMGLDLTRYFPGYEDNQKVLRHIARDTAGNINLGLDLQGGIHVILAIDDIEFFKKGAVNTDEQFREFIAAAAEKARGSIRTPLEILKSEAASRDLDLPRYYAEHYREKYGLEEKDVPDTNEKVFSMFEEELDQANRGSLDILRTRVDKFGVAEPEIQVQGDNELLIQMPGVSNPEQVMDLIQGEAFLEFRLVDDNEERLAKALETGQAPPGFELKSYETTGKNKQTRVEKLLVREKPELTGETLTAAWLGFLPTSREPIVHFKFDKKGARIFSRVTQQYNAEDNPPGRRLAILLDGKVLSAPLIRTHIPHGEGYVEGHFNVDEARLLSSQLSAGAYPAPLMVKEQRTVGPSLGEDSIRKGIKAAVAGLIVVVLFMAAYYLLAGLVADFALCLNIVLIVGALSLLPSLFGVKATLTLPGIAGIILTIGMAVDANVLIFERIREEQDEGKGIKQAIANGYQKAFVTILDANLTTIIAALVLLNPFGFAFLPTAGPIKGFALTLTIGIITSMFTALVVTRTVFDLLCLSRGFTGLTMLRFLSHPNIDFIGKRKFAFAVSGSLIVLSVAAFIYNGEKNFGIDFSGG
ncbi:MAG TPA: protein translocase subunit SecD, partial [bacterium]|nr:protein translocase subunit SecD [bacterium]